MMKYFVFTFLALFLVIASAQAQTQTEPGSENQDQAWSFRPHPLFRHRPLFPRIRPFPHHPGFRFPNPKPNPTPKSNPSPSPKPNQPGFPFPFPFALPPMPHIHFPDPFPIHFPYPNQPPPSPTTAETINNEDLAAKVDSMAPVSNDRKKCFEAVHSKDMISCLSDLHSYIMTHKIKLGEKCCSALEKIEDSCQPHIRHSFPILNSIISHYCSAAAAPSPSPSN